MADPYRETPTPPRYTFTTADGERIEAEQFGDIIAVMRIRGYTTKDISEAGKKAIGARFHGNDTRPRLSFLRRLLTILAPKTRTP